MKKVYYIGSTLLVLAVILFVFVFNNINDHLKIAMFIVFITSSIYTNIKMMIVIKYPPKNSLSSKERLNVFLFFLGKAAFILMLIRFGYFSSNLNDSFMLILFMLHQSLILDYTYIHNNLLITLRRNPIDIGEIRVLKTNKLWGQYYVYSCTEKEKNLNFNLSEAEYNYLIKIKNINK